MKTIALLAAVALTVPSLALAAPYGEAGDALGLTDPGAVRVSSRGLDLSRPHDAAAMLTRISTAAMEACGASDFSIPEYRRSVLNSDCYRASLSQAVHQLDAPSVNALYGQNASASGLASLG